MAFTVTARHSGTNNTTSSQALATNSVTPTANSLLLSFGVKQNDNHGTSATWQLPVGGGHTYSQVDAVVDVATAGDGSYLIGSAVWQATVGASPTAHTITVDAFSGTQAAYYSAAACDITGHGSILRTAQNAVNLGSYGNTFAGTVSFPTAITAGNLIVLYMGKSNDAAGAFAAPTIGTGKNFTQLLNQSTTYNSSGLWYRVADGTEATTATCADLGQSVGSYSAFMLELTPAGGGPAPNTSAFFRMF